MLGDHIPINIVDQEYIEIDSNALLMNSKTTLVLALLGRASLPEKLRETHVSLEYVEALDVLSVRDSTCTTDKTIYSTIIIASIALLLFFIATNLVDKEQQKEQVQTRVTGFKSGFDSQLTLQNTENLHFLRMTF